MSKPLPVGGFKWLTDEDCAEFTFPDDDSLLGHILGVDLDYPSRLQELHNDYPLVPESVIVEPGMLSE